MLAPMLHAKCRRAAPRAAAAALRGSSSMVHELGQRLKKLYEAKPVEPQDVKGIQKDQVPAADWEAPIRELIRRHFQMMPIPMSPTSSFYILKKEVEAITGSPASGGPSLQGRPSREMIKEKSFFQSGAQAGGTKRFRGA
ncbi:unnamed protein product [Durusdinium trenchii]|uniref:Uncharacterized protein n=1 Tax=Durusdinium trenchii TaxID=1381693 RepID=A0ABP0KEE2_9DINO